MTDYISRLEEARAEDLAQKRADKLGLDYLNLKNIPVNTEALKIIPFQKAKQIKALVFDKKIREFSLATVDPETKDVQELIKEIRKFGNLKIFAVSTISFLKYLENYQLIPKTRESIVGSVSLTQKFIDSLRQAEDQAKLLESYFSEDFDVSEILSWIIAYALFADASDLHLEPKRGKYTELRYRIDGILYLIAKAPEHIGRKISDRLKLLSQVNLNIRNVPQDGRFTIQLENALIEVRFSTIPGPEGENLVMRFLNPKTIGLQLEDLGLRQENRELLDREVKKPNGLILVTGPTGSGKTTTLYACLKKVAAPENKVITLEDPIEYRLQNIEQTQVDSKAGYTFALGLRAILRQDPDIILVGEIRDQETAEITMHASLTGHLVFSTLHTNNAPGAIPRLLDFEVKPEIISAALNLIVAQRLTRKLCQKCKKPVNLEQTLKNKVSEFLKQEASLLKNLNELLKVETVFEARGCKACNNKGYKGRVGVFEMILVDDKMQTLIHTNPDEIAIKELAKKSGSISLMADGLIKVLQGVTDFNELEKVVGPFR
jgi:type IV pilus assembly protein PilB